MDPFIAAEIPCCYFYPSTKPCFYFLHYFLTFLSQWTTWLRSAPCTRAWILDTAEVVPSRHICPHSMTRTKQWAPSAVFPSKAAAVTTTGGVTWGTVYVPAQWRTLTILDGDTNETTTHRSGARTSREAEGECQLLEWPPCLELCFSIICTLCSR